MGVRKEHWDRRVRSREAVYEPGNGLDYVSPSSSIAYWEGGYERSCSFARLASTHCSGGK